MAFGIFGNGQHELIDPEQKPRTVYCGHTFDYQTGRLNLSPFYLGDSSGNA